MVHPAKMLQSIARGLVSSPTDRPRVQWLMDELTWELSGLRRAMLPDEWKRFVADCRAHVLCTLVHQDPFTRWSFQKPRGYPGDASLLDLIYGEPEAADSIRSSSPLGQSIFARNRNVPSCRAVRYRKALLTERLRSLAGGRVLSVACGHLREMRPVDSEGLYLTAFDSDERSLEEVRRTLGKERVATIRGSIRNIVAGRFSEAGFDFVYAAGLYDYLGTPLAQRLTQMLFEKLRSGGTLLIANFTPATEDVGYMEAYKDWWLIFRDEAEMLEIVRAVPRGEVASLRIYRDPDRHIVFTELTRGC